MATSQRLEQIASLLAGPVGSACKLALHDHDNKTCYEATLVRQLINPDSAGGGNLQSKAVHSKPQDHGRTHRSFLGVLLGALYGLVRNTAPQNVSCLSQTDS